LPRRGSNYGKKENQRQTTIPVKKTRLSVEPLVIPVSPPKINLITCCVVCINQ